MLGIIDLEWDTLCIIQRIDYWGLSFRCLLCHHNGHLLERRPRHFHGNGVSHQDSLQPSYERSEISFILCQRPMKVTTSSNDPSILGNNHVFVTFESLISSHQKISDSCPGGSIYIYILCTHSFLWWGFPFHLMLA